MVGLIYELESKEVRGAKVQNQDGSISNIKARKGVILAYGSFEYNHKMLENYVFDPLPEIYPMGTPYSTGDGFAAAQEVGAFIRHTADVEFGAYCVRAVSQEYGTAVAMANTREDLDHLIVVNKTGKRFMNESGTTQLSERHPHPVHEKAAMPELEFDGINFTYPNLPCWFVFDESRRAAGALASWTNEANPGSWSGHYKVYTWSDDNMAEINKGWVLSANTIEELAQKMEVDAGNLKGSIESYNAACAQQGGDEFGRTKSLTHVESGPFYAVEMTVSFINTQGGPKQSRSSFLLEGPVSDMSSILPFQII